MTTFNWAYLSNVSTSIVGRTTHIVFFLCPGLACGQQRNVRLYLRIPKFRHRQNLEFRSEFRLVRAEHQVAWIKSDTPNKLISILFQNLVYTPTLLKGCKVRNCVSIRFASLSLCLRIVPPLYRERFACDISLIVPRSSKRVVASLLLSSPFHSESKRCFSCRVKGSGRVQV